MSIGGPSLNIGDQDGDSGLVSQGTKGHDNSLDILSIGSLKFPLHVSNELASNMILMGTAHLTQHILRENCSVLLILVEASLSHNGSIGNVTIGRQSFVCSNSWVFDQLINLLRDLGVGGLDVVRQCQKEFSSFNKGQFIGQDHLLAEHDSRVGSRDNDSFKEQSPFIHFILNFSIDGLEFCHITNRDNGLQCLKDSSDLLLTKVFHFLQVSNNLGQLLHNSLLHCLVHRLWHTISSENLVLGVLGLISEELLLLPEVGDLLLLLNLGRNHIA